MSASAGAALRRVFEGVVAKCITAGLVGGPSLGLVDVYAATLPSLKFSPGVHVNYAETVLPMRDFFEPREFVNSPASLASKKMLCIELDQCVRPLPTIHSMTLSI